MLIRKANANDIDAVAKIYDEIHTEIEKGNYATGWVREIYPLRSTAQNAFEKDWLFVAEDNGIKIAIVSNNYMIPQFNSYEFSHFFYTLCYTQIILTWSRISTWMIV